MRYKRNQIESAIAAAIASGSDQPLSATPHSQKIKRLLDTDRNLGRAPKSRDPARSTYAFYSETAPGSGVEVWFQEYEVFALLTALRLLDHGFPQQKCVLALRNLRSVLEREYARIARQDPRILFDQEALSRRAAPGQMVVGNTDPVFLVIFYGSKTTPAQLISATICRGEADLMHEIKSNLGGRSIFELSASVHLLRRYLSTTEPSQRGRAPS